MTTATTPPRRCEALLALLVLSTGACTSFLAPESGSAAPKDPGTLVVHVRDDAVKGVKDARVSVEMPNSVGSFFTEASHTGGSGNHTFSYVPAGRRRVQVDPPRGFDAGAAGLVQHVDVVKDKSTTALFVLTRRGG